MYAFQALKYLYRKKTSSINPNFIENNIRTRIRL